MAEVLRVQFAGQCEMGDTVGFLFSHHGNQRTGLTHIIRLLTWAAAPNALAANKKLINSSFIFIIL